MTGILEHEASSATTTTFDPWLGCVVGDRYRIEEWIGQGGMGVVYRGEHLELGKRVAIKRLDPRIASDPSSFERFRREAIAASRIESPHVVHVFDWGKAADGSPYLVMELLEGCDLRQLLQREGRLLPESAATIIGQVLRALVRTHEARIIHRDLKPENVFLCRYDSEEPYVKLLDFGISKRTTDEAQNDTVTRRGVILGTASYMSPEQARGEVTLDGRSDLYSVGAMLFEALTGRVPHRARTYEGTLVEICTRDADDVRLHAPLLPEAVALVVSRALQRDVAQRFASAKEFLDALTNAVPDVRRHLSDSPAGPSPIESEHLTASNLSHRARVSPRALGTLVLTLGAGVALWWVAKTESTPQVTAPTPPAVTSNATVAAPPLRDKAAPPALVASSTTASSSATSSPAAPKPTTAPSPASTSAGRATSPRPTTTLSPPASDPNTKPGVASGLKLRRTMP